MESLLTLLIEDHLPDAELIVKTLLGEGLAITPVRVACLEDLQRELASGRPWRLALCEHTLAGLDGREAFALVREALPELPFIFLSDKIDEEEAIEIVRNGATDYVPKGRLGRLAPSVQRALKESDERRHRRQAEESLQARVAQLAEADRRKDEFLAMLAHELRNPLAPILSSMQMLKRIESHNHRARTAVEIADRQVRHMARLLDDLLDVSRITKGRIKLKRAPIDLGEAMLRSLEISSGLIQSHQHRLVLELPEEPVTLMADPDRLDQVFVNLLNNAAKYTPSGGRIEFVGSREGDTAVIQVRDNGIGIASENLEAIFEVFCQSSRGLDRSEGGLGLGLALVRSLVTMHGGTVVAESDGKGKGARFILRMPCAASEAAVAPPIAPKSLLAPLASPDPSGLRVLLVDDNVDAVKMLGSLLRLDGHLTKEVFDGEAALEAYREFQPEVALVDIGLPKLDGYQVAQRLRRMASKPMTLIAVTGYGREEDRRRSREAGFDHHLVKPVDVEQVEGLLNKIARQTAS